MSKKIVGLIHNVPVSPGQDFSEASADIMTQVDSVHEGGKGMYQADTRDRGGDRLQSM